MSPTVYLSGLETRIHVAEVEWPGDKATCSRRRWNGLETRLEEGRLKWLEDVNSKLTGPAS